MVTEAVYGVATGMNARWFESVEYGADFGDAALDASVIA